MAHFFQQNTVFKIITRSCVAGVVCCAIFASVVGMRVFAMTITTNDSTASSDLASIMSDTLQLEQDVHAARVGQSGSSIEDSKPILAVRLANLTSRLSAYTTMMTQMATQSSPSSVPAILPPPLVMSIVPSYAKPGDTVVITATNLSSTANSVALSVGAYDNSSLYTIPSNGGTINYVIPQVSPGSYDLYVRTLGTGSDGTAFTVDAPTDPTPTIDISNDSSYATMLEAPIGRTRVLIHGSNFTPTGNSINFNGTSVATVNALDNSNGNILAYTAPNLPQGVYSVTVSNANGTSKPFSFALVNQLKINSISPTSGPLNTIVTVTGSGFTINQDNYIDIVTSSGSDAPVRARSTDGTTLTFAIPYYNMSGNVTIYIYNTIYSVLGTTRLQYVDHVPFLITTPAVQSISSSTRSRALIATSSRTVSSVAPTPTVTPSPSPVVSIAPFLSPKSVVTASSSPSPVVSPKTAVISSSSPRVYTSPSPSPSSSPSSQYQAALGNTLYPLSGFMRWLFGNGQ